MIFTCYICFLDHNYYAVACYYCNTNICWYCANKMTKYSIHDSYRINLKRMTDHAVGYAELFCYPNDWISDRWFCTKNCITHFIIRYESETHTDIFGSKTDSKLVDDVYNEQYNIWQRIVVNGSNILIRDLLNIVCEYAQK